jgi:tetraacyldisaccharide 4'-kinase
MQFLKILLIPISWLYGAVTFVRNKLYDWGVFSVQEYSSGVISIGNLSAGGTGKTPMVEYLIELLQNEYSLATLSRGYKRKTSGYYVADISSTAMDIGDEPLQYKKKFSSLIVAVDGNRKRGIKNLREQFQSLEIILLDDAFQHRSVKAGLSIVLTDYSKLFFEDTMLPAGTLREYADGMKRADIIVVSKTPANLSPIEKRVILKKINALEYQKIYFSHIQYSKIIPVNDSDWDIENEKKWTVLMLSGIANPEPLQEHLTLRYKEVIPAVFADHHTFTEEDLVAITAIFNAIENTNKIIITTEKDWMRLQKSELQEWVKKLPLFYIPIKTDFNEKDKNEINPQIINYVRTNKGNHRVYKE